MGKLHTRRCFLQRGLTVLSAAYTMPLFLQRTVYAINNPADLPLTQAESGKDGKILVVIQLSGGNDGLATVVPLDNDDYRRARPQLAITKDILRLNNSNQVGLHSNLTSFKDLFDNGKMAVIQGVGYPNPNRSHFRSMEIWQTAQPDKPPQDGWLGRYFDAQCKGSDPIDPKSAIQIGARAELALHGSKFSAIAFQRPEAYQWFAGNRKVDPSTKQAFEAINEIKGNKDVLLSTGNPTLDFLERTALDAQMSSEEIRSVTTRYRGGVTYPNDPFAQQLQMVAQMIAGGLSTRVYYISLGGFDTHTNEKNVHDRLMATLSAGIGAFMKDLKQQGNADRTLLMTFSEFGRRVSENASRGTDHGTAAPMFVFGEGVRGGVIGDHPSLRPDLLDHGDLKYAIDFRNVYATVLERWLKTDSSKILGQNFKTLPIL